MMPVMASGVIPVNIAPVEVAVPPFNASDAAAVASPGAEVERPVPSAE